MVHGRLVQSAVSAAGPIICTLVPVICTLIPVICTLVPVICTLFRLPVHLFRLFVPLFRLSVPLLRLPVPLFRRSVFPLGGSRPDLRVQARLVHAELALVAQLRHGADVPEL